MDEQALLEQAQQCVSDWDRDVLPHFEQWGLRWKHLVGSRPEDLPDSVVSVLDECYDKFTRILDQFEGDENVRSSELCLRRQRK